MSSLFPEEPLALSSVEGFGFFPAHLEMELHDGRYRVVRKLGRGQLSSTWLVYDSRGDENHRYRAIKILTAYATKRHHEGHLLELKILQTIDTATDKCNLPRLVDHFEMDGPHGRHLCLVLPVLSETVDGFRLSAPSKSLEPRKVKIIISEVGHALIRLHDANIIHNDIQANNVLFIGGTGTKTIEEHLHDSPQKIHGEFKLKGSCYPIMQSQPIPSSFLWSDPGITVELYILYLADFGCAHWVNEEPSTWVKFPTRNIGILANRAPEVILGANYGVKVDIWALGCMTFELLTGHVLFHPGPGQTQMVDDNHLAKMVEVTGENFSEKILAKSRRRNKYFDETGKLLHIVNQRSELNLELTMIGYGVPETRVAPAADLIRTCLRLDPDDRPSIRDLLHHPWLKNAHVCCGSA